MIKYHEQCVEYEYWPKVLISLIGFRTIVVVGNKH
jgi:hypothetical protein